MKKIFTILALSLSLVGCNQLDVDKTIEESPVPTETSVPTDKPQEIMGISIEAQKSQEDISGMNLYNKVDYNFLDELGYVAVYTSAEKLEDNSFAWDDGQEFMVEVYDGENCYYPLERSYIQLGVPEITLFTSGDSGDSNIIIEIITSSGIDMKLYTYSRETQSLTGEYIYENNNINLIYG